MKIIAIIIVLVLSVASFMLFFNADKSDDMVSFTVEEEKVALLAPDAVEEAEPQDEGDEQGPEEVAATPKILLPTPDRARFKDTEYYYDGSKLMFSGVVYSSQYGEPMQGITVVEYCDDEVVTEEADVTGNHGGFDFVISSKCTNGEMHRVMVEYNDIESETDNVEIWRKQTIKHGSGSVVASLQSSGVPEFSTVALALVILGGSLGLAVLRKD